MQTNIQEEIDKKIQKASDWNIKLLNTLNQLESQTTSVHTIRQNHKTPIIPNEEIQEKERKIIKNIEERIKIYQKQLSKLEIVKSQTYLEKIKLLQANIEAARKKSEECSKQIRAIQDSLKANKKQDAEFDIKNYTSNVETLKQRLKRLQSSVDPIKNLENSRKKAKSSFKSLKQDLSFDGGHYHHQNIVKRIDKEAMYRNLIKYYSNEQIRLKQDILRLQKQRKNEKQEGEKLDEQIANISKKIDDQRKKKKKKVTKKVIT